MIVRHYDAAIASVESELLQSVDYNAIHVDQLLMAQYVESITYFVKVIDKHNAYAEVLKGIATWSSKLPLRLLACWEWPRLAKHENHLHRQFDKVIVVSEDDAATLREWAGLPIEVSVMPIGLAPDEIDVIHRKPTAKDSICVGSMQYPPNEQGALWFIEEVFP